MLLTSLEKAATTGDARPSRVALAGNPNCGKTSLFSALTRTRQHVTNDPGGTVERRVDVFELGDVSAEVVDLPGTCGLSAFAPEEREADEALAAVAPLPRARVPRRRRERVALPGRVVSFLACQAGRSVL